VDLSPVRCFYHPGYEYPLPPEHPFPMDKFRVSHDRLIQSGVGVEVIPVEPIPTEDLLRVHEPGYIEAIRKGSLGTDELRCLGLPLRAGELWLRSCLEVAGTLAAVHAALEDGLSCNLAGGTHHAYPSAGMGYCVFNDVAVAIRSLHARQPGLRVLVVDTDAHQGNGTAFIFGEDPRVFTYSIHVGANYPSRKERSSWDVPLPRYVSGGEYLCSLEESLSQVLQEFPADLAIWIAGADCHINDRFGQMSLSNEEMRRRDQLVLGALRGINLPVAVLYGGGYNRTPGHTAQLHADTVVSAAEWC
jgi:acetoin utilization deacetylase AcuC-like enzyme